MKKPDVDSVLVLCQPVHSDVVVHVPVECVCACVRVRVCVALSRYQILKNFCCPGRGSRKYSKAEAVSSS